jgi:zinc protease
MFLGGVQAAPRVERWQHPSGAQVAWVEAAGIPMLDLRVDFDAGSRRDPADQPGLADAMALMSQRGVAASTTEPALDENGLTERWMDLGAQWSVSASPDRLSVQLRTLTDAPVLNAAVGLAARALAQPAWTATDPASRDALQTVWQRDRERWSAQWRNRQVQPDAVAWQRFQTAVYGTHPYGAVATPDSWARITLDDMQRHWQRHVQPCHARVSLVGAVSREQADALVSTLMAGLQAHTPGMACSALPPVPEVAPLKAAQTVHVPMDTAQTHVLLGQPGHTRRDPDYFPLLLGNYVLGGGGFVSRLTTEVREKRGLSYGAYSYFMPGEHAGAFMAGLQTRPEQADNALAVAREVIAGFVAQGPTDAELKAAKDFMVNGFALRIDTNRKLLDNVANILWFDLPPDYLQRWTEQVQAVTVTDIRRAFARVLQPQRMVAVVVGGKAKD